MEQWTVNRVTNHSLVHFSPSSIAHTPVSLGQQARRYTAQAGAGVNAAPNYFM